MRVPHYLWLAGIVVATHGAAAAELQDTVSFEIAAQPLDRALLRFSEQASIQVLATAAAVEGKNTQGLHGRYVAKEALTKLLEDSGLKYKPTGASSVTISATDTDNGQPQKTSDGSKANSPVQPQGTADMGAGVFEEVVITAQRRAENLQDVPIAITALNTEQLGAANIQGQMDLPKLTTNLNFTSNTGYASPYIRGVGTPFGNPGLEPSVSVYFDDIYIPRASSALFSFGDIERVEVLKGPQGTLYGRNATGGAIRILLKDPVLDAFQGRVTATAGSDQTRIIDGMVNLPLSEGIAVRFAARHDENDGYIRNLEPDGDARGHERGQNRNTDLFTGRFLLERGPLSVKLTGDYGHKDDRESMALASLFPGAPEQIGAALGGTVSDGFMTYGNDDLVFFDGKAYGSALRIDYDIDALTLSSISGWRKESERNCADIDASGTFIQAACGRIATEQFTQEFQVTSDAAEPLRYVGGLYYLEERSGFSINLRASAFPPGFGLTTNRDNVRVRSIAPFAQLDYDISPLVSVSLGARYTYEKKKLTEGLAAVSEMDFSTGFPPSDAIAFPSPECTGPATPIPCNDPGKSTDFRKMTYKATVSVKPMDDVLLYGTISRGFKSGGLNLPAFGFVDVVRPETLDDYEIGFKTEFGPVRWNGSLFYYDYKDLQIAITDQNTGVARALNAAAARMKGVETDISFVPIAPLEIAFGGSFIDAQYRDFSGDAYVPCGEVAGLAADTSSAAAGVAAGLAACAAQGGLGLALVSGQDLAGEHLVNTPKWTAYGRVQYTLPTDVGTFVFGGIANYRSTAYFDPANRFPDRERTLFSARISWTSPSDRLTLAAYGENLSDERFDTIQQPQSVGGWRVPAPPRQFFFMAQMNF